VTLKCILCQKEMQDQASGMKGDQDPYPMGGLAFETFGHYGSSVMDSWMGTKLTVCICDECVRVNKHLFYGKGKLDARWEPYKG